MAEDMVIFSRVFDLLEWLVPKGETFPRPFRHTVTARLLDAALDMATQHVSRMVAEVGRLLGGWIRQATGEPG